MSNADSVNEYVRERVGRFSQSKTEPDLILGEQNPGREGLILHFLFERFKVSGREATIFELTMQHTTVALFREQARRLGEHLIRMADERVGGMHLDFRPEPVRGAGPAAMWRELDSPHGDT